MRQGYGVALLALAACGTQPPQDPTHDAPTAPAAAVRAESGLDLAGFDRDVRPQDDLYRFAGGGWLASHEIPPDKSTWGTFEILQEQALEDMRAIAEAAAAADAPPGSDAQKIGDFYTSFMDEAAIEAAGLEPLAAEFARIDAIRTHEDLARYFGESQRKLGRAPVSYYVSQDQGDATRYIGILQQSGLSMPDRDYYLSDDARYVAFREAHRAYVERMLTLAGEQDAAGKAARIADIETRVAGAQWTKVQNRDPVATYNRMDLAALEANAPGFDWSAFFAAAGVPADAVDVNQPTYLAALAPIVRDVPVEDWRTYLRFQLLDVAAPYLPAALADARFDFHGGVLKGVEAQPERWKRGVRLLDGTIGELVGQRYVAAHFRPESKARMQELVANLLGAFAESIGELEWMTPATKEQAREKLAKFTVKIGYPDVWRDYSPLEVTRDDLYANIAAAVDYGFARTVARLGGPIDRDEWHMTPQTVNAYYNPVMNEIVFPAAILQPPFFDPRADDAVNYGAIGAVIGHEISHGFDDSGRRYDGDGNLRDWWTAEDAARFEALAAELVEQYGDYTVLDGKHLNGKLTLGENIGDLSGVAVAWKAWRRSLHGGESPQIDGFTGAQRFFLGWAQGWRREYRDNELLMRLVTDPHSPSEFRANGVVTNLDAFHAAFGLEPGDGLYRAPADRVKIW